MKVFKEKFGSVDPKNENYKTCRIPVACSFLNCKECRKIAEYWWASALRWALDSAGGNCDWDKIEQELGTQALGRIK